MCFASVTALAIGYGDSYSTTTTGRIAIAIRALNEVAEQYRLKKPQ